MQKETAKLRQNRLGDGRIREEEQVIFWDLWQLLITASIGSDDIVDI